MSESKQELLIQILLQNSALDVYKNILQSYRLEDIFVLARQDEQARLAFRATWNLEHILLDRSELLDQYQAQVVELFVNSNNDSSLRSTSKLVMTLLKRKSILSDDEQEAILNKTFQLMERNDCPVALLVNCWDILLLCAARHPWIAEELYTHIHFQLDRNATPASKSRGLRILKKLERITHT